MIADFRRRHQNASDDELIQMALHHQNSISEEWEETVRISVCQCNEEVSQSCLMHHNHSYYHKQTSRSFSIKPSSVVLTKSCQQRDVEMIWLTTVLLFIGPGGSGKTTLYKRIVETCRAEGIVFNVFTTTGIAATLMDGGLTAASEFLLVQNQEYDLFC